MIVRKTYTFSASHQLLDFPKDHQCRRLHGHNYKVVVECEGPVSSLGVVIDFGEISNAVKPLIHALDHCHLNDVMGVRNPTAENLCVWLSEKIPLQRLTSIEVWETDTCCARWSRNEREAR